MQYRGELEAKECQPLVSERWTAQSRCRPGGRSVPRPAWLERDYFHAETRGSRRDFWKLPNPKALHFRPFRHSAGTCVFRLNRRPGKPRRCGALRFFLGRARVTLNSLRNRHGSAWSSPRKKPRRRADRGSFVPVTKRACSWCRQTTSRPFALARCLELDPPRQK
jgi:hypothetical protein